VTTQVPYAMMDSSVAAAITAGNVKISGDVVQVVYSENLVMSTTTTVIPNDDTIPQITEGYEVVTATITPKSAANNIKIETVLNVSPSVSGGIAIAFFQDAIANALAAGFTACYAGTTPLQAVLTKVVNAGSTTARTYRTRVGMVGAGTLTINGAAGARYFGGVMVSSMTVTEIQP
jgi:hypothetical protein